MAWAGGGWQMPYQMAWGGNYGYGQSNYRNRGSGSDRANRGSGSDSVKLCAHPQCQRLGGNKCGSSKHSRSTGWHLQS